MSEITPAEFSTLSKTERDAYYKQRICVPTPTEGADVISRVQFLQLYHTIEQYTTVLDVGCHDGFATRWMALDDGVQYIDGIDPCEAAIEWARKLAPNDKLNYDLATWEEWAKDNVGTVYDCVVAFELLEHFTVEEGAALIKFCHNMLAPGGRAFVSTPEKHGYYGIQNTDEKEHLALYTLQDLEKLIHDVTGATPEVKLSGELLLGTWQKD